MEQEQEKEVVSTELTDTSVEKTEASEKEQEVVDEKKYSEEELNKRIDEILPKKIARREEKIKKDYDRKYGQLENVVKAGLGVETIDEAVDQLTKFYEERGTEIPNRQELSEKDVEVLAREEAKDIIENSDDEEIEEEANNLAQKGIANMTQREKLIFDRLANYLTDRKSKKELAEVGIGDKELNDKDFLDFAKDLNPSLSLKEKYEKYEKYRPKPKVEPMDSMKGSKQEETGIKEFYTRDEALQFTREDFDKNPKLFEAIEKSSYKW